MTNTKQNKEFEIWAMKHLLRIQKELLLEDYYPLTLNYGCENSEASAECKVAYPYKTITIGYSDSLVKDWSNGKKDYVIAVLTHEMCHVVTDPFYIKAISRYAGRDEMEQERERLTDHIANVIIKIKL